MTSPTPPADVASSGAETAPVPLEVASAPAAPTVLAVTGIDVRWLLGAFIILTFVGWLLILVGPDLFRGKEKRS